MSHNSSKNRIEVLFANSQMYAVERFYDAPLVWNVTCAGGGGDLSFLAVSAFKQQNKAPAKYAVECDSATTTHRGKMMFAPHWRPTELVASRGNYGCSSGRLTVIDEWDQSTSVNFTCSYDMINK